jgi:hypothetical protein
LLSCFLLTLCRKRTAWKLEAQGRVSDTFVRDAEFFAANARAAEEDGPARFEAVRKAEATRINREKKRGICELEGEGNARMMMQMTGGDRGSRSTRIGEGVSRPGTLRTVPGERRVSRRPLPAYELEGER